MRLRLRSSCCLLFCIFWAVDLLATELFMSTSEKISLAQSILPNSGLHSKTRTRLRRAPQPSRGVKWRVCRLPLAARLEERLKTMNHGGHWEHGEVNDSFISKIYCQFRKPLCSPCSQCSPRFHNFGTASTRNYGCLTLIGRKRRPCFNRSITSRLASGKSSGFISFGRNHLNSCLVFNSPENSRQ